FVKIPKGFIPSEDTDQVLIVTEAQQGASPFDMFANKKILAEIRRQDPKVKEFMSSVLAGSSSVTLSAPIYGRSFLHLVWRSQRKLSVDELMAVYRSKLNSLPAMKAFLQNPPSIRIGGTFTKSLYQYTLQGTSIDELYKSAASFEKEMAKIPLLVDVSS